METEKLSGGLSIGTRVNILEQRVVVRHEEAVVSVLRVEIHIESVLLDAPIEDVHVLVDESRECDRNVSHRVEHLISKVNGSIAAKQNRIHEFRSKSEFVVRVVEHGVELAWHRIGERVEHVDIDHLGHNLVRHIFPASVVVLEHLSRTLVPVLVERLIARYEHDSHILLECHVGRCAIGGGRIELVPPRVEFQESVDWSLIRCEVEWLCPLTSFREIALLEEGVDIGIIEAVIFPGCLVAGIVRSAIAVEQLCVSLCMWVVCNPVRHVRQRSDDILHPMNESVRAFDVLLHHHGSVDIRVARLSFALIIEKEIAVSIGDELILEKLLNEVNHRRRSDIAHAHN